MARLTGRLVASSVVLAALMLAPSGPAFGFSQRGHVFGFSFAGKGATAGRLSKPAGVAVNEATGDEYWHPRRITERD
jgi:hypothetical protein